jgi:hypothetical protein
MRRGVENHWSDSPFHGAVDIALGHWQAESLVCDAKLLLRVLMRQDHSTPICEELGGSNQRPGVVGLAKLDGKAAFQKLPRGLEAQRAEALDTTPKGHMPRSDTKGVVGDAAKVGSEAH